MSMRNERPDSLDTLIDNVARQMIAGEPSPSLRGAVRERIAGRPVVWSLVPAWGVAVGVLIAALIVGRALLGPPSERDNIRPTIEHAAIPAEQPPAIVGPDARSVPLQADQVRLTRRPADDVAAVPQEEEPLIPPIAIEPLETVQIAVGNPITVESSGVMPIEIEPLQIEPLRGIE